MFEGMLEKVEEEWKEINELSEIIKTQINEDCVNINDLAKLMIALSDKLTPNLKKDLGAIESMLKSFGGK